MWIGPLAYGRALVTSIVRGAFVMLWMIQEHGSKTGR
jgi:hypothetical protein